MATQSAKPQTQGRPTKKQKQIAARRAAAHRNAAAQARRQRSGRLMWIAIVIVVVIGIAFAVASRGGSKTTAPRTPAPAALVAKVTSVPTSVIAQIGAGTATAYPKAIKAAALTTAGKPRIVFIGEEACPYCATERWAVVNALSRFGTFTGLSVTHSSTVDAFPATNTFSFYGAKYTSAYLSFESVELTTNQLSGSSYKTLETPTAEQQQLMSTYDVPPYVTAAAAGGIPFIDLGGKYMSEGAQYDPTVLQGQTADQIATALSDPTSAISKGAIGAANTLTAALCTLTHNQPATTCTNSTITTMQSRLG